MATVTTEREDVKFLLVLNTAEAQYLHQALVNSAPKRAGARTRDGYDAVFVALSGAMDETGVAPDFGAA